MQDRQVKWTDEQVAQLIELRDQKLSCALIASRMACGFTRNSIIGKLFRLGLSNSDSTVHRKRPAAPKKERVHRKTIRIVRANGNSNGLRIMDSAKTELEALRCVEVIPRNISLSDIERGECRYPYGDGPFTFCGHPTLDGKSYCGPHHALTRTLPRTLSPEVRAQRRQTFRANFKLGLAEDAA